MANNYYTFTPSFVPGQKVRSDEVNLQYAAVEDGFDNLPTDVTAINRGKTYLGTESGAANALVVTLDDPRTTYLEADRIYFKSTISITGPATVDVDGIGAVALVSVGGDPLASGDVVAGIYYEATYDLTNNRWQMTSASASIIAAADDRVTWAEDWAITPEDTLVPTAAGGDGATDYSSLHWAAKSEGFASAASASASNASTSETNAAASAVAAAASAAALPTLGSGDQTKYLKINATFDGYDIFDIFASQAQVNAGTATDVAVSPDTLANWTGLPASTLTGVKTADTDRANTTTTAIDPDLQFAVEEGKRYAFILTVFHREQSGASQGIKVKMDATSASHSLDYAIMKRDSNTQWDTLESTGKELGADLGWTIGNASDQFLTIQGQISNVTGAGVCGLYWAQNASNANATRVFEGSTIVAWELL